MEIEVLKEQCTGCMACYSACPAEAISIKQNKEGFYTPYIDTEKCINCGLCKKVCPQINNKNLLNKQPESCYAAYADKELCKQSSSGGIFSLLAEYILDNNGYVCGAAFSEDFSSVKHIIIDDKNDLYKLRSSKYLQSFIGDVLKKIKTLLQIGKTVLFSGTPCQIAGLKSYLGQDYSNLITVDLLCHGAPSPLVWEKYLQELTQEKELETVNFRDKKYGWHSTLYIKFTDGTVIRENSTINIYFKSFLQNLLLNNACYTCKYTNSQRAGDITLGDFWGIENFDNDFQEENNTGVSLIIINNLKGEEILNKIASKITKIKKHLIGDAIKGNPVLENTCEKHYNRKNLFKNLKNLPVIRNMEQALKHQYDGIIANFWWSSHNYGAVLSAYAIQQFFKEQGFDYSLLNNNPYYKIQDFSRDFVQKYLKLTHKIHHETDLSELNNCTDNFVVGTDQVFRYKYIANKLNAYTLAYTNLNKKRIAFSASFGKDKFDESGRFNKYYLKKCLQRFDAISVREVSGIQLCKKNFNVEADNILDPVFLIDRKLWENIANSEPNTNENGIVSYILDETEETTQIYDYLGQKYEKKIIKLANTGISPEKFLSAIKNSEYFVTDSFHGICFALIFNKKVICLINERRGKSRFQNLVQKFGIESLFFRNLQDIKNRENPFAGCDLKYFNEIVEKERNFAGTWLKNAMNKEKDTTLSVKISEFLFQLMRWTLNAETLSNIIKLYIEFLQEMKFKIFLLRNRKSKIVLWGASLFLKDFLNKYKIKNKNIIGIIDKDSTRHFQKLCGYTIYPPEKISELNADIIVCTIKNNHEKIYPNVQNFLKQNYPNIRISKDIFR